MPGITVRGGSPVFSLNSAPNCPNSSLARVEGPPSLSQSQGVTSYLVT